MVIELLEPAGSDRTVAKDERTSDRTTHDHHQCDRYDHMSDRDVRMCDHAIKKCLAWFPMSVYVEHCLPLGASCSTHLLYLNYMR